MRVISGSLKGRKLLASKGMALRPTSDRVRESIFDILQNAIGGMRVLDLFAGTGALGIEALSRGAARAVFVEGSSRSLSVLGRNIEACGLEARAEVLPHEMEKALGILAKRAEIFDLVFADPPYGKGLATRAMEKLSRGAFLAEGGLVVAEHSPEEPLDSVPPLKRVDQRKYGRTLISFFQRDAD